MPDDSGDDLDLEIRLEAIAEQYLDQLQKGQAPDREALLAAHPDLAEVLDKHLRLTEAMHQARVREGSDVTSDIPSPPPVGILSPGPSVQPAEIPERVGPYRILEVLGVGGMGEIYLAQQEEPIRRRVALKLIKLGMDTREVVARFDSERQALALMDHPHIARVYEAGATEEGRPYFVMELVQGEAITRFCDEHRLTTPERLRLVCTICDAVQHAHQKGVIHRDLKPSNVLVSRVDGEAVPKIIDFGVAKAIDPGLTAGTALTEYGILIGTPEYMSPEQAGRDSAGVDTRTDIYSLGVILYELLVGAQPFDSQELRDLPIEDIRRRLREDEPDRPSTRLTSLGEKGDAIAEQRRVTPRSLARALQGDLDSITMMAMDKDRDRRYATASDLGADIRRHLNDDPILARPPTRAYQFMKFYRKHRRSVVAASVVALSLLGGLGLSLFLYLRADTQRQIAEEARQAEQAARAVAEEEREAAEQARGAAIEEGSKATAVRDFLVHLLASPNPRLGGRDIRVVDVLQAADDDLKSSFRDQPEIRSLLLEVLGNTYVGLGMDKDAVARYEECLALRRETRSQDRTAILRSMLHLAACLRRQGDLEEAEVLCREILEADLQTLPQDAETRLTAMVELSRLQAKRGDLGPAQRLCMEALEIQRRAHGDEHRLTLAWMDHLARIKLRSGSLEEARDIREELAGLARRVLGEEHPNTLGHIHNHAYMLKRLGAYDDAERILRDLIPVRERVLGESHPGTLLSMRTLADLLRDRGKPREAEEIFQLLLDRSEGALNADDPRVVEILSGLAEALRSQGRLEDSEALFRRVAEYAERKYGPDHPETAVTVNNLANALMSLERFSEAEPLYRRALEHRVALYADDHPRTLFTLGSLGICLCKQGKYEKGLPAVERVVAGLRQKLGEEHPATMDFMDSLAVMLRGSGDRERSAQILARLVRISEKALPKEDPRRAVYRRNFGVVLLELGRTSEAEGHLLAALRMFQSLPEPPRTAMVENVTHLRDLYRKLGNSTEAEGYEEMRKGLLAPGLEK